MSEPVDTAGNGAQPREDRSARLPVLASPSEARPIDRLEAQLPAPVVAATGGFLAGVAAWVLVRVLRRRRLRPGRRAGAAAVGRGRRRGEGRLEVAASRSFLVDVHVLRR